MNTNIGLSFLADTLKCSDGYAISYAHEKDTAECWKIVLSRKTICGSDVLDIVSGLNNKDIFIHVVKERVFDPERLINTAEFLFKSEPSVWAALFGCDYIVVYVEDLEEDSLIEKFASIRSCMFWKYVNDIYPNIQNRIGKASLLFGENEPTAEDLLATAESIVPYVKE